MATKVISTRIDEKLIERFDEKAAAANITRNELIAKLISDFLGGDGIVDKAVDKSIQVAVDKAVDIRLQDAIAKQSPAAMPDIDAMIAAAIDTKLANLSKSINQEFIDMKQAIAAVPVPDIAPVLARLEALENSQIEATAPANFSQALSSKIKGIALQKMNQVSPLKKSA